MKIISSLNINIPYVVTDKIDCVKEVICIFTMVKYRIIYIILPV